VALDALTDNQYVFASASEIRLTGVKGGELPHVHSFGDWTVTTPATCTEAGVETRTCECGETETREIPALGHDWQADGSCSRCDEKQEVPVVNPFEDVPEDSWYINFVLWAVENGITSGMDATHFGSNEYCTRSQVVTFLYSAFGKPDVSGIDNPFTDVAADAWYAAPVLWAVKNGITSGIGGGLFGTDNICSRAQIVTFLYKAYN
jgi:hypothetical protein